MRIIALSHTKPAVRGQISAISQSREKDSRQMAASSKLKRGQATFPIINDNNLGVRSSIVALGLRSKKHSANSYQPHKASGQRSDISGQPIKRERQ